MWCDTLFGPPSCFIPYAGPPQHWLSIDEPSLDISNSSGNASSPFAVLTKGDYFLIAYGPTLLATLLTIPFQILDLDVKSLEPFRQLSKSKGSPANYSLFLHFSGMRNPLSLHYAAKNQFWAVFITSFLVLISTAIAAIAPETASIGLRGSCPMDSAEGCHGVLQFSKPTIRVVQSLLSLMALLTLALLLLTYRWKCMVCHEPRSIASIASLSLNSEIQSDFNNSTDSNNTPSCPPQSLEGNTYGLGNFESNGGGLQYGIIRTTATSPEVPNVGKELKTQQSPNQRIRDRKDKDRTYYGLFKLPLLAIFLVGVLIIVIYYHVVSADSGFERFMESQRFGVRCLFALLGIVINIFWAWIYQGMFPGFLSCS